MSHYAKVLDGKVVNVIVAEPEFFETFVDSSPGEWLQTSYNTRGGVYYTPNTSEPDPDQSKAFRKNFAGIGFTYDRVRDAFIPPKPHADAVFDEDKCDWIYPHIPYPTDGKRYGWNEAEKAWVELI